MVKTILSYGIVSLLAVSLLAGMGYILLNPTDAQAERNSIGGQEQGQGRRRGSASDEVELLNQNVHGLGQGEELSDEEIAGLLFMREEEKLARDVYLILYEQWDLPIFQNIAGSEQTHMDSVGKLIDRYGLDDPAADNDNGEFTDPMLQSLYDDLVAVGSQSLADALRVGAAIEEIDILDLEERVAQTSVRDIQRVYDNLMIGSRNHLRSFVATLEQQSGETYEPRYLDQEAYDGIVNTPMESGGYGRGGSLGGAGAFDGRGQSSGTGQSRNEIVRIVEWETLTGEVIVVDSEITIQTAEGQVLVGMGQAAYWVDFGLKVGDEVSVTGFHEDGEFKAGTVENLATGETVTLRDETGRPMWAGQGRLKNRDS